MKKAYQANATRKYKNTSGLLKNGDMSFNVKSVLDEFVQNDKFYSVGEFLFLYLSTARIKKNFEKN